MCTYNGELYVAEQLRSIIEQSVTVSELVVADDGSTDSTLEIVRGVVRSADLDVKILTAPPSALGSAQNFSRALAATRGSIVFLADQDDVWEKFRVAKALEALGVGAVDDVDDRVRPRRESPVLAVCNAGVVDHRGDFIDGSLFSSMDVTADKVSRLNSDALEICLRQSLFPGMTFAMRRELLDIALPIPARWPHDYWLVLVAALADGLVVSDERLVRYRQHSTNVVGLRKGTVASRLMRLLHDGSDTYRLSTLFGTAVDVLRDSADIDAERLAMLGQKCAFEQRRHQLSGRMPQRFAQVARLLCAGQYSRFASNGSVHALRDVLNAPQRSETGPSNATLYSGKA